jgi:tRNA nucleotidyltransferase/poly(A) polymerase
MNAARELLDDPGLRRTLEILNGDGEEARLVGGAVRNALLGRPSTDFDIATTGRPEQVIARAKKAGIRTVPTGLAHGTVTLLCNGRSFEVTTLREDVETDGRHAKIRFGRDFALDARRRDFTINALSLSLDGEIYDYTDGLADIAAARVRFIGDPATRIREDYLRILRFFRFSADYAADEFDTAGVDAAISERAGLRGLSHERIRQELLKLLVARRAVAGLTALAEAGLLAPLLSCVPQPARLARLLSITPEADALLRLAATAAIVSEDAARLRDMLRLSNAETARIAKATAARSLMHGHPVPDYGRLRETLFACGRQGARDGVELGWAESAAPPDDPNWQSARAFVRDTPEPQLPFSSADLIARGIAAGRPLGIALKRLQAAWIRAGFPQDPRRLATLLDEVLRG